jgi:LiaI-LiaF-like transmembrane region
MSAQFRCRCQSCTIRGMMGPAILITLGILFLLHQVRGGRFDFGNTWPLVLVVIGLILLASSLASREGHVEPVRPPIAPPPPPPVVAPPTVPPQTPYAGQGQ